MNVSVGMFSGFLFVLMELLMCIVSAYCRMISRLLELGIGFKMYLAFKTGPLSI